MIAVRVSTYGTRALVVPVSGHYHQKAARWLVRRIKDGFEKAILDRLRKAMGIINGMRGKIQ